MNQLFSSPNNGAFGRRVRRARGARIPVIVVTGFLGAGKTTLLQHFLKTPEGHGTALVVNEFGAAGIDDALLRASADETVLLGNGCLCCNTRSDLQIALRTLVADRDRGAIPDFRRIVIETSGLADPSPILQTFATDRALGDTFHVDVLATAVDAVTGLATLEWSAEARKQIILADVLLLTKADIAEPVAVEALTARLRTLNPRAALVTAKSGVFDPRCLIEPADSERNLLLAEAAHSDGIASFTFLWRAPLPWETFSRAMETLTALRGPDVLRVKGFLNVAGCRGPVLVQFVQHLSPPPVELERWPDEDRDSRVVFITRNLAEKQVRDLFAAVAALAPASPGEAQQRKAAAG
jgi:G3E family GTPase